MLFRFSPLPDLRYAQVVPSRSISEGCSQNGKGESPSQFIGEGLGMGSVYNILAHPTRTRHLRFCEKHSIIFLVAEIRNKINKNYDIRKNKLWIN